jgi:hypothetical protein
MPGAAVADIVARQRARLSSVALDPPLQIAPNQLERFVVEMGQRGVDAKIASRVYIPMRPEEVERMRAEQDRLLKALE